MMKQIMKTITSAVIAAGIAFAAGAAPMTMTLAAELTAMDKTAIEDDLKDVDLDVYPKNKNGRHQLIDNVGFMEYAYSSDSTVAGGYFGIYFYVYNPTEREVSTRAGANVVNMAVAYNAAGEPTEYANCAITVLDHTDNHRFYKFKLTNSAAAYDRAKSYASAHNGERRYDIAGIQIWFAGDANATAEIVGKDASIGHTYICTGYGNGCGADPDAESTLKITYTQLETISLDIQSTWYRTGVLDGDYMTGTEYRNTLSSVYFSIPNHYIEDYGALQIVKCEWYEYQTMPIFVTDSKEVLTALTPYLGYELPIDENGNYYDSNVPFEFYHYIGPSDSGIQGTGWNKRKSQPQLQRYDWLIEINDIAETVDPESVRSWAENYPIKNGDDTLTVGTRNYNANLFSDEVDEGHIRGYNVREFDARDKSQWINLKLENQTSAWKNFLNIFLPAGSKDEDWLVANDVLPIEEITSARVSGNDTTVSNDILVAEDELEELRNYVAESNAKGETVYILRFSVSDYYSMVYEYHHESDWTGFDYIDFYGATDTVYLSFDIIHLGFVRDDIVTIIPVAADPIDIYPALTPPTALSEIDWIFIAILGAIVIASVLGLVLTSKMDGGIL